jgi:arylsulfatase A-like enzyme
MNAICLVIDRLHAGYLGAYGNSWIETPSLDRLASRSLVFDRAAVDSPQLERLYRSYWQGWHAMCPPPPAARPGLASLLREAGISTALLTDDPSVAKLSLAEDFDELIEIDPPWQPKTAAQVDQTHFARCFVEIINWLDAARGPFLLWCHLGGLGTTWDAPLEFRQGYCEEGDPPPPTTADVPDRCLPPNHDPDELLGVTQSYAGQVKLLDTCFGAMLEYFDGLPVGQETLLTLTSSRGFPLGEHRRVGPCDNALYGELVQVPWMMYFPDDLAATVRSQSLVEPSDLWATLLDWWNITAPRSPTATSVLPLARGQADAVHDRLCMVGYGVERAIRTPAWHLRTGPGLAESMEASDADHTAGQVELFAKPDDRREVNDVASRCREVVECLQDAMLQYELTLPSGQVADLPPLSDVLRNGM